MFAYADPPYLGCGKLYAKNHPEARVWDDIATHQALIAALCERAPDGWAMSASSPSLRHILSSCPDDVRVAAWVKPFAIFKPNVGVAYSWEPIIFRGGRKRTRQQPTVRDWVSENITLRKGLTGAKPPKVCEFIFDLMNAEQGDTLVDVFPGTGIVTETWKARFDLPA